MMSMKALEIAFDEYQVEAETVFGCVGNRGDNFVQIAGRFHACSAPRCFDVMKRACCKPRRSLRCSINVIRTYCENTLRKKWNDLCSDFARSRSATHRT